MEWLGPGLLLMTVVLTLGLVPVLAVRWTLRRWDPDAHWTQQARLAHAARVAVLLGMMIVPVEALLLPAVLVGPPARVPGWVPGLIGAALAFLVSVMVGLRLERRVLGQPVPDILRYATALAGRWLPVVAVLMLAVTAPARLGSPWMVAWLAAALAVGMTLRLQPGLWRRLGLTRPADQRVAGLVGRASQSSGVPVEGAIVVESHLPNALAFPWLGTVAFTTRALEVFTDDELEAIARHELAHLAEPGPVGMMRQTAHFVWIPVAAVRPLHGTLGLVASVVVLLFVLVFLVLLRRMAVHQEVRSDERAAEGEPAVYGRALAKAYRTALLPAVQRRASHGQLHHRLRRAGVEPEYDPPAPPPRGVLLTCGLLAVLLVLTAVLSPWIVLVSAGPSSPTPALVGLSLGSYGSWPLERLGYLAEAEGDTAGAATFYDGAARLGGDPQLYSYALFLHALSGGCDQAAAILPELEHSGAAREDLLEAAQLVVWCRGQPVAD